MKKINFINVIKKIFDNLSLNKKIIIGIFFIFSLFSAFAETASISSVIPFMDLMIDPNKLSFYLDKLNIEINLELFTTNQMLILITLIFITIIFLATLLKILLGYIGTKISVSVTHEMNTLVFSQVVNSDYLTDNKNDENNINASIYQVNSVTVFLEQFLSIISNLIILSFVLLLVISLTDQKVIYASLIFFSLYFLITFITKRILFKNSELLAKNYNSRVVHLNNTIALFKNIKVDFLEKYFFVYFKKIDYQIAKSSLINTIAVSIPGTLMISFAIIIFSILILITNLYEYNLIEQIPIYAALVFGTQKMLPMMQNIYGAIAKMRANSFQALIALELISKNKIKLKKKYHIDFEKRLLMVKQGKGNKDRTTILSELVIFELKNYLKSRPYNSEYVFASHKGHISARTVEVVIKTARRKAKITKNITPHSLRHSFATHHMESGTRAEYIQKMLGHKDIRTTKIYERVSTKLLEGIRSPHDKMKVRI